MELRITRLIFTSTKLEKKLIICLFFFLLTTTAEATEYIVSPAPNDQAGVSIHGEKGVKLEDTVIPYWQFLLWLAAMHVLSVIDVLLNPTKIIFAILGFRIGRSNVFDNPNRSNVYTYIKASPGAYISEIAEKIGLERGEVKRHVHTLRSYNIIEAYIDGIKIRYFENNSTYDEDEIKVISALQNITNKRIISEIRKGKCNTNLALAHEIGVSKATISWYIKTLKEIGLIEETKMGRNIMYKINSSYENLIEKYE